MGSSAWASCAANLFAGIDAASMSLGMRDGERPKTSRNCAHFRRSRRVRGRILFALKTNRESASVCAAIGRDKRRFKHGRPSDIMARRIRINRTCRVDTSRSRVR